MLAVKCKLTEAEKIRKKLIKTGIYDFSRLPERKLDFIYFPILKKIKGYTINNIDLKPKTEKNPELSEIIRIVPRKN